MDRYSGWGRPFSFIHQNYLRFVDRKRSRLIRGSSEIDGWVPGRVSIPIATYDRISVLIERTLPALFEQSYKDIEVIVIGDGTDEDDFARLLDVSDPRLILELAPKRQRYPKDLKRMWMVAGSHARNRGMDLSSGEWFLWMSDDDILHPNAIETLIEGAASVPGCNLSCGGTMTETAQGAPTLHLPSTEDLGFGFAFAGMPAVLVHRDFGYVRWNRFSHMKDWNRPSDYDLFERISGLGVRPASTDDVLARIPLVASTGLTGSAAFAREEGNRRRFATPPDRGNSESGCDLPR